MYFFERIKNCKIVKNSGDTENRRYDRIPTLVLVMRGHERKIY